MRKETYKSVGKKVLASALSAAMVVAFAPAASVAVGSDGAVAYAEDVQVVENAVAQVGNQQYVDVNDALEAWGTQGGTLTLLNDCTSTKPAEIGQSVSCSLDLAGHKLTIRYEDNKKGGWQGITVKGSLTLNDSSDDGSGLIDFANPYIGALNAVDNGSITVNGGTIVRDETTVVGSAGAVNLNDSSSFVMNGGCLKSDSSTAPYALKMNSSSSAEINAGSIEYVNLLNNNGIRLTVGKDLGNADEVSVEKISGARNGDTVSLKSGTIGECSGSNATWEFVTGEQLLFVKSPSSLIPSSLTTKTIEKSGAQYYTLVSATQENSEALVRKADGSAAYYGTAQQAANSLSDGDTLVLQKDIETENGVDVKTANVTVDLNGHNIKSAGAYKFGLKFAISSSDASYQAPKTVNVVNSAANTQSEITAWRPISAQAINCVADVTVDSSVKLNVVDDGVAVALLSGARMSKTDVNIALTKSSNNESALWSVSTDKDDCIYGGASFGEIASTAVDHKATLLSNWKSGASLSYAESQDLTLDLDGHTITHTGGSPAINADRAMTGKLSLQNGTIDATDSSASCIVQLIAENAKIDFENVALKGKTAGIAANGSLSGATGSSAGSSVSIKGGSVEVGDGIGIYWPVRNGSLALDGVKISAHTGVQVCSGSLAVKGNTVISASGIPVQKTENDGAILDGSAISVINRNGYGDITGVSIEGGSFTSKSASAVKAYSWNNTNKTEGTFDNDDKKLVISAGAFSSDPDNSYKAAGTETHLSPKDGMYHVHAQNADVRSDSAKAPTCTEPGYTAGSYCGIDGYQYSNGSTIPALGHEAGEYVVTTPATETTEGVATSTCTRCGEVLGTKTIEKLKPAGTEESGTSDTGEKVDVTVSDNTPGKTESGTEYVGSVEFNGSDSGSTGQSSSEANIPETVEVNGSTYVVTKIADEAFKDQEQLKSISIPATVIEVGKSAFEGTGVQSIVIPAATSSIGASAFKGCADLKTIDIQSAALKEIPASAFEGCASLQTANVPATIEKVGAKAFAGTAISDVILPEATTEIGASAFKDCESLKTVEFKGGVTAISNSLFQGAKALETIELPTSVTTIGKSAFEGTALKSLALPAAVKTVGSKAFASTPITSIVPAAKTTMAVAASGDGTLVLPAGLTTLGTSAFAGCASLKTATLPAKIKALAASTFSGCTALKSVDISGVAAIGKSTFAGDKALKSLKTGTKLTTIGSSALSGAKALKTLSVSTKKLTKKGVKSSLKGSSVKTVKVKASKSKKTNKKYIAKYKKYFAKKNSGKKVTVK